MSKLKKLTIRAETPSDYAAIYALTEAAFAVSDHADGDEQELPARLRKKPGYIPELSLVAELDGQLAGHILFTEIKVGGDPALLLGPVSVLPAFQGQGIGGALIEEGHRVGKRLGFDLCVLTGHEGYYPRFGYEPVDGHGILIPEEAPPKCKMVKFLTDRGREVKGTAIFPPEFTTTIRAITPADYPLLEDFLYHAVFQPPGAEIIPREVIFEPEVYLYIDGFNPEQNPGDVAAVAEKDGKPIAIAWTRIIPAYGHIDAETPELAVSVLPAHRGQGIGAVLMEHLFDLLRERGCVRTSLAVQKENPACRFYRRLGYEVVRDKGEEWLMVKVL
ncbi:MAG: GNAT family N-acetyltransferase [Oscillospiraceae bacterium]|nr:GNAT family N-acetyltransferase [Oscillospiraceae bacterium]